MPLLFRSLCELRCSGTRANEYAPRLSKDVDREILMAWTEHFTWLTRVAIKLWEVSRSQPNRFPGLDRANNDTAGTNVFPFDLSETQNRFMVPISLVTSLQPIPSVTSMHRELILERRRAQSRDLHRCRAHLPCVSGHGSCALMSKIARATKTSDAINVPDGICQWSYFHLLSEVPDIRISKIKADGCEQSQKRTAIIMSIIMSLCLSRITSSFRF